MAFINITPVLAPRHHAFVVKVVPASKKIPTVHHVPRILIRAARGTWRLLAPGATFIRKQVTATPLGQVANVRRMQMVIGIVYLMVMLFPPDVSNNWLMMGD